MYFLTDLRAIIYCKNHLIWAWSKSWTRTLGFPSKFISGTRRRRPPTPLRFKSGTSGPPSKFKSGTPETSPFFNSFFFSEYFFFLICFFSSFLNNKHNIRPYLVSQTLSGDFICGLRGISYTRKSLNVRNRKSRNFLSFLLSYF